MRRTLVSLCAVGLTACGGGQGAVPPRPQPQPVIPPPRVGADSTSSNLVPPGFGTLKQDDISIVLELDGYRVATIPLDESVIRLLAPDSYRGLKSLLDSKRPIIVQRASARGIRDPRVWQVKFFGLAPDSRFVPTDITVTSGGREYRPIDVIGITQGFGEQRLQARDTQTGLLVFEDGLDISQPVVVSISGARNTDWGWDPPIAILRKLDTERSSIRARASGRPE